MPETNEGGQYPKDVLDLKQMNRALRHKLRNLCAGVKMTMDRIASTTAQSNPQLSDRCRIINSEMDGLQRFTERMDMLFDTLPQPQGMTLFDIASSLRGSFIKEFPLCSLEIDGAELDFSFPEGSWLLAALSEILRNAGEAAGPEGHVAMGWGIEEGAFIFRIANGGVSIPKDIPLDPPRPFHSPKSRHDGLGLSIAYRICKEASFTLDLGEDRSEGASVAIRISPGDFLNGQA